MKDNAVSKRLVLFVRVSSDEQDYLSQIQELEEYVKGYGYTDDDWIVIAEKESGTKLSDKDREGLNKLFSAIETHPSISCIYITEISRLSRRPATILNLVDFLVEKKIDLCFMDKRLHLLNKEKELDENTDEFIGMYIYTVKSEIKRMVQRFRRGRNIKSMNQCFVGGKRKFGYVCPRNIDKSAKETKYDLDMGEYLYCVRSTK